MKAYILRNVVTMWSLYHTVRELMRKDARTRERNKVTDKVCSVTTSC